MKQPLGAWLVLAMAMVSWAPPALAVDDSSRAAARTLVKEGATLFKSGRYEEARLKFMDAYGVAKVPTVAVWAAQANEKLGTLVAASELYESAILMAPNDLWVGDAQPKAQQQARDALKLLKPRIPALKIVLSGASPSEVAVTVDGVTVPSSLLAVERSIDPGVHTVTATRAGKTVTESVTLGEMEKRVIMLLLPEAATPAVAPTVVAPPAAPLRPIPPTQFNSAGPLNTAASTPPPATGQWQDGASRFAATSPPASPPTANTAPQYAGAAAPTNPGQGHSQQPAAWNAQQSPQAAPASPSGPANQVAPPSDSTPLDSEPGTRSRWYGGQILLFDLSAVVLGAAALATAGSRSGAPIALGALGAATYLLGPPIDHWAHGNAGRGFASLGIRIGAPVLFGLGFGFAATKSNGDPDETMLAVGAGIGYATAVALDVAVFARDRVKIEPEGTSMNLSILPIVGTTAHRQGVVAGVAGNF
jgi:hypothetical protein